MDRALAASLLIKIQVIGAGCGGVMASQGVESLPQPIHVRYTIEYHAELTDLEYEALRSRVAGRPEHPERRALDAQSRRRQNGPEFATHELWADTRGVVRHNSSNVGDDLWFDVALDGDVVRGMSPAQLTLVSRDGSAAPDTPAIRSGIEEANRLLSWFLSSGRAITQTLPVGPWHEAGGTALAAEGEGMLLTLTPSGDGGATVKLERCDPMPESIGLRWEFTGSVLAPGMATPIPKVLTEYTAKGRVARRIAIDHIGPTDKAMLDRVSRTPRFDGEDPVRGPATFVSIYDHRPRDPLITVRTGSETSTIRQSQTPDALSRRTIRWIGWITAGGIVSALVCLRIRART